MIKLSWMARATDAEVFEGHVRFARELDLDVIDFHVAGMPREPEFLRRIKMLCVRAGLPIGYLGSGSLAGPAAEKETRLDQAKEDVDLAAFLGAQMVRSFARHKWPDTVEEQEAIWGPMIESFQELCDYAAEKGVVIGLQNHNHGSFAMNADQVLRILSDTDRENLTFIMDTGQWQGAIGGSPRGWRDITVDIYDDYMKRTASHASYIRAKIYKIDSGREEWLDYPRIMKILRGVDFNGNISIVFEGGDRNNCDEDECLKLAARYLRQVITESE